MPRAAAGTGNLVALDAHRFVDPAEEGPAHARVRRAGSTDSRTHRKPGKGGKRMRRVKRNAHGDERERDAQAKGSKLGFRQTDEWLKIVTYFKAYNKLIQPVLKRRQAMAPIENAAAVKIQKGWKKKTFNDALFLVAIRIQANRRRQITMRSHNKAMDKVKDASVAIIVTSLTEFLDASFFKISILRYMLAVKIVQRVARNFIAITRARHIALAKVWHKLEMKNSVQLTKYIDNMVKNSTLNGGQNMVPWIDECNRAWHRTHKKVKDLHGKMDELGVGGAAAATSVEDQVRWGLSSHYMPHRKSNMLRKYLKEMRLNFAAVSYQRYLDAKATVGLPDCCREFHIDDALKLMVEATTEPGDSSPQLQHSPMTRRSKFMASPKPRRSTKSPDKGPVEAAPLRRFPLMLMHSLLSPPRITAMIQRAMWEKFAIDSIEHRWKMMQTSMGFYGWKLKIEEQIDAEKAKVRSKFKSAGGKVLANVRHSKKGLAGVVLQAKKAHGQARAPA